MISQEHEEILRRIPTFPLSSLLKDPILPDGVVGQLLGWKTNVELENIDKTALDATLSEQNILAGFTKAGLPAAATAGRLVRVTDDVRGVWMDTGAQWFALNGDIFNVKEFGATGDGSTDDTVAIQAALDAADAPPENVKSAVYFPAGTYMFSNLLIADFTLVFGQAIHGQTVLKRIVGSTGLAITDKGNAQHISLKDIRVELQSVAGTGLELGFGATPWGSNGMLENFEIRDGGGIGIRVKTNVNFMKRVATHNFPSGAHLEVTQGLLFIDGLIMSGTRSTKNIHLTSTALRCNLRDVYIENPSATDAILIEGSHNLLDGIFFSTATSGTTTNLFRIASGGFANNITNIKATLFGSYAVTNAFKDDQGGVTILFNNLNSPVRGYTQRITHSPRVKSITASGTMAGDEIPEVFEMDATAGTQTLTLPLAADLLGEIRRIIKVDSSSNFVFVDGAGAETINGSTDKVFLGEQYDSVDVFARAATDWIIVAKNYSLGATVVWDPGSIAVGAKESKAVTVTNAALGDFVLVSPGVDVEEMAFSASVISAGNVEIVLANNTAAAVDLGSSTWTVKVIKGNIPGGF